jgi:hypothetical protein
MDMRFSIFPVVGFGSPATDKGSRGSSTKKTKMKNLVAGAGLEPAITGS